MQLVDVLAIVLVLAAGVAFFVGEGALARAEDLQALYWLIVGVVALRAAVQVARPGASTDSTHERLLCSTSVRGPHFFRGYADPGRPDLAAVDAHRTHLASEPAAERRNARRAFGDRRQRPSVHCDRTAGLRRAAGA